MITTIRKEDLKCNNKKKLNRFSYFTNYVHFSNKNETKSKNLFSAPFTCLWFQFLTGKISDMIRRSCNVCKLQNASLSKENAIFCIRQICRWVARKTALAILSLRYLIWSIKLGWQISDECLDAVTKMKWQKTGNVALKRVLFAGMVDPQWRVEHRCAAVVFAKDNVASNIFMILQ